MTRTEAYAFVQTDSGPWFTAPAWPRYQPRPLPHNTVSDNGMVMVVDLATEADDLCPSTSIMLHGLDRERQTTVCIMPAGHDTPHMPQSPESIEKRGRLIIRSIGRPAHSDHGDAS